MTIAPFRTAFAPEREHKGMKEMESKETIDKGARLAGATPRTVGELRRFDLVYSRALTVIKYTKPYMDKFRRLANLCLTLFKYHTFIPTDKFEKVVEMPFGKYVTSEQANQILLRVTDRIQQAHDKSRRTK